MKKINIGLFVDTYFPMIDGVIMVVDNYAKRLTKYANVYVFAPSIPGKVNDDSKYNYKVIRCKSINVIGLDYSLPLPNLDRKFKKKIDECNLDIIHIHSPVTIGKLALKYAKKNNIPVIATMHSQYKQDLLRMTKSKTISNIVLKYIMKVFNNCDECWTLNKEIARIFKEEYGYIKEPILINNATEMLPVKEKEKYNEIINKKYNLKDEKILIFVGRINKLKNIDLIVKSLKKVTKVKYKMFFIGTGQDEEYLKKLIRTNGLEDKIYLLGKITDRDELARFYARSDLQLFPSLYDTNSLVQIEAASQNTPTLFVKGAATACNIIDGVNGYISDNKIKSYANKIEEILLNEDNLKKVSDRVFKDIYVNWDDEVERIYEKYLKIIEKSKLDK